MEAEIKVWYRGGLIEGRWNSVNTDLPFTPDEIRKVVAILSPLVDEGHTPKRIQQAIDDTITAVKEKWTLKEVRAAATGTATKAGGPCGTCERQSRKASKKG